MPRYTVIIDMTIPIQVDVEADNVARATRQAYDIVAGNIKQGPMPDLTQKIEVRSVTKTD